LATLLETITCPGDVKRLGHDQLIDLASDLRAQMVAATSTNGGHLASSLGAVELVLAAHRVLDLPHDRLLFDVGHQSYAHKMLTGRLDGFALLRHKGGTSGFTRRKESEYDVHDSGHASDALATAAGVAAARDLAGGDERIVTVVGDASFVGGLSYEAANFIGQQQFKRFVVILNDNEMSISPSVGAFASYLARIRTNPHYYETRDRVEDGISSSGRLGSVLMRLGERAKEATKRFVMSGMFFEEMGFTCLGPIDGHDVRLVQDTLARALEMGRPVLIHAVTKKGKGYAPAEANPSAFHGVGPFDPATGQLVKSAPKAPSYTKVFADALVSEAARDERVVAITAAMMDGTGLAAFAEKYPNRTFDVGIAEECAVTLASGMAIQGMRPVVAVYSTFLQRAYDEIATNVCLQELPVVFAVDRGGLVGEDGSTHHGAFDLAYLRTLPNMKVAAPSDEAELVRALRTALLEGGPVAVRYPRGSACGTELPGEVEPLPFASRVVWGPEKAGASAVTLLAVGRMVATARGAAELLAQAGVACRVVDMRWVKPLDVDAVREAARGRLAVTLEDGTVSGGFGSAVAETVADEALGVPVLRLGLPDAFVGHGSTADLFADLGLDAAGVARSVEDRLARIAGGQR